MLEVPPGFDPQAGVNYALLQKRREELIANELMDPVTRTYNPNTVQEITQRGEAYDGVAERYQAGNLYVPPLGNAAEFVREYFHLYAQEEGISDAPELQGQDTENTNSVPDTDRAPHTVIGDVTAYLDTPPDERTAAFPYGLETPRSESPSSPTVGDDMAFTIEAINRRLQAMPILSHEQQSITETDSPIMHALTSFPLDLGKIEMTDVGEHSPMQPDTFINLTLEKSRFTNKGTPQAFIDLSAAVLDQRPVAVDSWVKKDLQLTVRTSPDFTLPQSIKVTNQKGLSLPVHLVRDEQGRWQNENAQSGILDQAQVMQSARLKLQAYTSMLEKQGKTFRTQLETSARTALYIFNKFSDTDHAGNHAPDSISSGSFSLARHGTPFPDRPSIYEPRLQVTRDEDHQLTFELIGQDARFPNARPRPYTAFTFEWDEEDGDDVSIKHITSNARPGIDSSLVADITKMLDDARQEHDALC